MLNEFTKNTFQIAENEIIAALQNKPHSNNNTAMQQVSFKYIIHNSDLDKDLHHVAVLSSN